MNNNDPPFLPSLILEGVDEKRREFKLVLVRHGISCSNLARARKVCSYDDPELTYYGRKKAKHLGRFLREVLRTRLGDYNYIVGASCLLRTQQTANLMINPETIEIIPYISEFAHGATGLSVAKGAQKALDPETQAAIIQTIDPDDDFSTKRNFSHFDVAPEAEKALVYAFMMWLSTHTYSGKNLVFFSHQHFITSFVMDIIYNSGASKHIVTDLRDKDATYTSLFGEDEEFNVFSPDAERRDRQRNALHTRLTNYGAIEFTIAIKGDSITFKEIECLYYIPEWHRYKHSPILDEEEECGSHGSQCRLEICNMHKSKSKAKEGGRRRSTHNRNSNRRRTMRRR